MCGVTLRHDADEINFVREAVSKLTRSVSEDDPTLDITRPSLTLRVSFRVLNPLPRLRLVAQAGWSAQRNHR